MVDGIDNPDPNPNLAELGNFGKFQPLDGPRVASSVGIVSETDSRCLQRFSGAWGTIWDISDLSILEKTTKFRDFGPKSLHSLR